MGPAADGPTVAPLDLVDWRLPALLIVGGALLVPAAGQAQCSSDAANPLCDFILEADGQSQAQVLRALEQQVLDEMNRARRDPIAYAAFLEPMVTRFDDTHYRLDGNLVIETVEGAPAVLEAIAYLRAVPTAADLTRRAGLDAAAAEHVADIGAAGTTGHAGTDDSTPAERVARHGRAKVRTAENIQYGHITGRDVVIDLIIDDGVPGRGHRLNIFSPDFTVTGVACGPHASDFGIFCVIEYAGAFYAPGDPRPISAAGILAAINERRAELGRAPLQQSEALSRVAAERTSGDSFQARIERHGRLFGLANELAIRNVDTIEEFAATALSDDSPLLVRTYRVVGISDEAGAGAMPSTTVTVAQSYR